MKSTLRRLSAVTGIAAGTALVAGLLVAPSASAAIANITPNTAFNSETAKSVTYNFDGNGGDYSLGGRGGTFVRLGAPSDSFTVDVRPAAPPDDQQAQSTIDFTDNDRMGADADGVFVDGPINAGTYNVTTVANDGPTGTSDACGSCFTVQAAGPLLLTALAPNSLRAGETGAVTLTGNNFERGTRIDLLLPGTNTVDSAIQANLNPPATSNPTDDDDDEVTTRTTLRRTFVVTSGAITGARDVRLTNVDGTTTTLVRGFSVNGAPLTSTTPTAGNNDPGAGLTRVTFNGSGLNTSGVPFLQYVQDPGSSTREALTLRGAVVGTPTASQFVADFDLRNAAPQTYQPVVRNPDGSFNACSCSFTIAQSPDRVTTVTGLDSDTATAGTDKSQAAGTTKSFIVSGTGFARGTRITVSAAGVTTTAVEFVSPTQLKATFQSTSGAATGDRSVTAMRTDGFTSAPCQACYTVTGGASPSATPTATTSPTASPSPSQSNVQRPTVSVNPSTITAVEQRSTVFGTAQPGSRIEIHAYSRPSTEYRVVRSGTVGPNGQYSFEVGPSGNTRLFARTITPVGRADSDSIVLTVRVSINLKITRVGGKTLRFTGSTLPKRPGQLVTVFYQKTGSNRVIASRARVTQQGTYNVTREFTGTGTFDFFTGTGTDITNAANNSAKVRLTLR